MTVDGRLSPEECEGKTIAHINTSSVNVLVILFTDGTWITWEVENMGHGLYGLVAE